MGKTGIGLGRIFGALGLSISGALAIRSTTRAFGNFENIMTRVGAVSGATKTEFARLIEMAKELGASTRFSATEAGEGLLFLVRAGLDVNKTLTAMPQVLKFAAASGLELGEAADFATNIMSQFNLKAKDMERVTDSLIITANRANTDVRQMAEAMKFAGTTAGAIGIPIEEVAAAIGVLGDRAIQSGMAGTNLRQILAAMLDPSIKATKVFKDLGANLDELRAILREGNLIGLFEELKRKGFDIEEAFKVFERRGGPAAKILTQVTERMRFVVEEQKNLIGETKRLSDIFEDTLQGAFRRLNSAAEAVQIALGEAGLAKSIRSLVEATATLLRELAKSPRLISSMVTGIKGLVVAITGLIALGLAKWAIAGALALIRMQKAALAATAALTTLKGAVLALTTAVGGFFLGKILAEEFEFMANLSVNLVNTLQKGWELIRVGFAIAMAPLQEIFSDTVDGMKKTLFDFLTSIPNAVLSLLPGTPQHLQTFLKNLAGENAASDLRRKQGGSLLKRVSDRIETEVKESAARLKLLEQVRQNMLSDIEKKFAPPDPIPTPPPGGEETRRIDQGDPFKRFGLLAKEFTGRTEAAAKTLEVFKLQRLELTSQNRVLEAIVSKGTVAGEVERIRLAFLKEGNVLSESQLADLTKLIEKNVELNDVIDKRDAAQRRAEQTARQLGQAFGRSLEDAVFQVRSLTDALESLGNEVLRIVFRFAVSGPLERGITGLLTPAVVKHGGGVVGEGGGSFRSVPASVFAGAPRLHSGLFGDEFPAILQRGETVLTARQTAAMGGGAQVEVNIFNNTGEEVRTEEEQGPGGLVRLNVIIGQMVANDIRRGGPVQKALRESGVSPRPVGR